MFPSGVKHPSIRLLNVLHWPEKGPRTMAEMDPGGHPHPSWGLRASLEEAPPPPSGTCSRGGGAGTGRGSPEKLRNLPEITQQIN